MAGKGPQLRKGANLKNYWDNYPFPEKMTVTQWKNKMGDVDIDDSMFSDIVPGTRITEKEYLKRVKNRESLSENEIEEFKESINSMGYSEFQKIKNRTHEKTN